MWFVTRGAHIGALFAILVLLGLMRLAANAGDGARLEFVEDRGVLALLLGAGYLFGQLVPVIQVLALLMLVLLMAQTYSARLTRA